MDIKTRSADPFTPLISLQDWLCRKALPLWAEAGFDLEFGLFHERLDFELNPASPSLRRLMVQCRQIATYARADIAGFRPDPGRLTTEAFDRVKHIYRGDDGIGWSFAASPDGIYRHDSRDLYAYAFVLYSLACLHKLTGDPGYLSVADQTIAEIDDVFAASGAGYISIFPDDCRGREQNPHMHLLEGFLALYESSRNDSYLARASAIVELFDRFLFDPLTGSVREKFNNDWLAILPHGENLIEPGHHFEWAWLLSLFERFSGTDSGMRRSGLIRQGLGCGLDNVSGAVFDLITEQGKVVSPATRIWPQTEAIRALADVVVRGDPTAACLVGTISKRLMEKHLPDHLQGGWFDRLDVGGLSSVDHIPASTLYHLGGAIFDTSATVDSLIQRSDV